MPDSAVAARTVPQLRAFGLLEPEYATIVDRLGREPNLVELGILGAMWSEHCAYKHSRKLLRLLPTTGPRVLQGPGENAGAVDIGDGLAVTLKMESHNHPSAVEPREGAATGVGGILRDIFTMGARPIALLDSLRFGDPSDPRTAHLVGGVIDGIGSYGNCCGVPTVGGEVQFDSSYNGNPLVNAMCIGVVSTERLTRAGAPASGGVLLLVGADTGRDGIQGAAFASNDDPEASHRGVVQVGNPLLEKLLIEACLEVIATGRVLAMQDLGAAGLTSSSVEMAARGGLGAEIDVSRVPRRELGMTAFEVMLSESQERMLLLVDPPDVAEVCGHFKSWDLHAAPIGRITDEGVLRIRDGETLAAELPISLLTSEAPAYDLTPKADTQGASAMERPSAGGAPSHEVSLRALLASPNLCSRAPVYRQYDSTVQGNTVIGPGGGAAVIRVEGTTKGLALTTDCTPRYTRIDPRRGAAQAVAEAARNVACTGAEPAAVTDCLNFGNPERPHVAWQLTEAVHGLAEACHVLAVPVVSGNVSLYNETRGRAIAPTPAIGMVGILQDVSFAVGSGFSTVGASIVHLGDLAGTNGASAYRSLLRGDDGGDFPRFDLHQERRLSSLLTALADRRLIRSAHDVSEGGLAVTLAECCFAGHHGARLEQSFMHTALDAAGGRAEVALFSEDQGRAIVSCDTQVMDEVLRLAARARVPAELMGAVKGTRLSLGETLDLELEPLRLEWECAFERVLIRGLGGANAA